MRHWFRKLLLLIFLALALLIGWLYASDNSHLLRAVRMVYLKGHTTANIYDESGHLSNPVAIGTPKPWKKHPLYNSMQLPEALRSASEAHGIKGLLVVKDNQIVYEEYWDEHKINSKSNSFSMAKTVNVMLIAAAIDDGFIKSIDQPISDFLPEYKNDPSAAKVSIKDLATMSSGYDWDEEYYSVINPTTKAYYGDDIEQQMLARKFIGAHYGQFYYSSGSSQLLGVVLHRAIKQPLATYLSKKIWQPMGMEYPATWSLDGNGKLEKTYCCINATVRDFAKLGQLMLNNGYAEPQSAYKPAEENTSEHEPALSEVQPHDWVINPALIKAMHHPYSSAFKAGEPVIYGYSTWLDTSHKPPFYAMLGHLGQRVIVVPSENLVITRVGTDKDQQAPRQGVLHNRDIYYLVDEVRQMLSAAGL